MQREYDGHHSSRKKKVNKVTLVSDNDSTIFERNNLIYG